MTNNSQENTNIPASASVSDIIKKGSEIYESTLKGQLEPTQNGKYVVIEVDSGKHFIGDTRDETTAEAKKEFPNKVMFIRRIGQIEKASRHLSYSHSKYARLF